VTLHASSNSVPVSGAEAAPWAPPPARGLQLGLAAAAVCLVFFQAHMVAPLVPALASALDTPARLVGLLVPAYALPYGVMALVYGPLSDRLGRRAVLTICLAGMALGALGAALAPSVGWLAALRVLAGISAGGVMPVALAYAADLYRYRERGWAIGVIFAALTLGSGIGMSLGPMVEPWLGWRSLFAGVAIGAGGVLALLIGGRRLPNAATLPDGNAAAAAPGYLAVLQQPRAKQVYALLLPTGVCSTGISAWFGVYLQETYGLAGAGIGLAYLTYAAIGCLSPLTGGLADRVGRGRLIPVGFAASAVGALLLAAQGPLALALAGMIAAAIGLQLTYPLLAALASELAPAARGRALGLNTFSMFMGVGWGSLAVGALLPLGYGAAFGSVAAVAALAGAWAAASGRGAR
jgi:predicted MFS family arabinose efflux permease